MEQMTDEKRQATAERIAYKLLDSIDQNDLEQFYWEHMFEWADGMDDKELKQTAFDLGVID